VGKTTTIAKLAGELVLTRHRTVALLTVDTYRVGAQDQLKAYADLLDIPFAVASTPAQLAQELKRFEGIDHVLIDTAGRSPGDTARVHELKGFCRAAPGIQVCLGLGANAGRAEFAAVVERFSLLPVEHAVVTKLDECAAPGRLYGCLRRHRLPVRWFTTGQEVPADIRPAEASILARRVVDAARMQAA
jgi:flagellar biosynthesis protein FlhF